MFKFLTKQFLYGRLYLWLKERIGGILLFTIAIFLIFYFHNEYLNYVEYKTKFEAPKNILDAIPDGESILWKGKPSLWGFSWNLFGLKWITAYLCILLIQL